MDILKQSFLDSVRNGMSAFSPCYFFFYNLFDDPYKKVRRLVPRYKWRDRDGVIQDLLFQIFLDFLEDECPRWEDDCNKDKVLDFKIVYDYLIEERSRIENIISNTPLSEDEEKLFYFMDLLEECDSQAEEIIFKWRHTLWT